MVSKLWGSSSQKVKAALVLSKGLSVGIRHWKKISAKTLVNISLL